MSNGHPWDIANTFAAEGMSLADPDWRNKEPFSKCALPKSVDKVIKGFDGLLAELGYTQTLLSATEIEMLKGQLRDLGLAQSFAEVWGLDNIHAGGKIGTARAWREAHPDAKALFVGDSVHDWEVASAVGADCVLFCGGHQNRETLSACGCPMIDHLEQLIEMLA